MLRIMKKNTINYALFSFRMKLEKFRDEIRGVAAIEFAFIFPLMLLLYVGTIEVSGAVSTNRKLSRVSSALGDLVTQGECFTKAELQDLTEIANDIMYPYNGQVRVRLTGIKIENNRATVKWSEGFRIARAEPGSAYEVPKKIKVNGNFLVSAYVETDYAPAVGWISLPSVSSIDVDSSAISMKEEMFLRPRIGNEIRYNNCRS